MLQNAVFFGNPSAVYDFHKSCFLKCFEFLKMDDVATKCLSLGSSVTVK